MTAAVRVGDRTTRRSAGPGGSSIGWIGTPAIQNSSARPSSVSRTFAARRFAPGDLALSKGSGSVAISSASAGRNRSTRSSSLARGISKAGTGRPSSGSTPAVAVGACQRR